MVDYLRLNDLPLSEIDLNLVRKFERHVFEKYDIPKETRRPRYSRASSGISPAQKIFMFDDSIYPYFVKVGKKSEVENESRKFGKAVVRLPALNVPPKEDFILGSEFDDDGELHALVAFRYVTGKSKSDPPLSLFDAYGRLSSYQIIEIIDDLFQSVLSDFHRFRSVKTFVPVEHLIFDDSWVSTARSSDIAEMIDLYHEISRKSAVEIMPHGFVHGDLHLNNILLGRGNSPVIIDFAMMREEGCLLSDFAEFEIALMISALRHEYQSVSDVSSEAYNQFDIFKVTGVSKFSRSIQATRANLWHLLQLDVTCRNLALPPIVSSVYRTFLLRYICSYFIIANRMFDTEAANSIRAHLREVFYIVLSKLTGAA